MTYRRDGDIDIPSGCPHNPEDYNIAVLLTCPQSYVPIIRGLLTQLSKGRFYRRDSGIIKDAQRSGLEIWQNTLMFPTDHLDQINSTLQQILSRLNELDTSPSVTVNNDVPVPAVTVNNDVPVPAVTVNNDVPVPAVTVNNDVPVPAVTVNNDVPVPDVTVDIPDEQSVLISNWPLNASNEIEVAANIDIEGWSNLIEAIDALEAAGSNEIARPADESSDYAQDSASYVYNALDAALDHVRAIAPSAIDISAGLLRDVVDSVNDVAQGALSPIESVLRGIIRGYEVTNKAEIAYILDDAYDLRLDVMCIIHGGQLRTQDGEYSSTPEEIGREVTQEIIGDTNWTNLVGLTNDSRNGIAMLIWGVVATTLHMLRNGMVSERAIAAAGRRWPFIHHCV